SSPSSSFPASQERSRPGSAAAAFWQRSQPCRWSSRRSSALSRISSKRSIFLTYRLRALCANRPPPPVTAPAQAPPGIERLAGDAASCTTDPAPALLVPAQAAATRVEVLHQATALEDRKDPMNRALADSGPFCDIRCGQD